MTNKKTEPLEQYDWFDDEFIEEVQKIYEILIGKFLIEFSRLEHSLDQQVAQSINDRTDEAGYRIIPCLRMIDKIQYLRSYSMRIIDISEKKDMTQKAKKIFASLEMINSFRNKIAHANWYTLDDSYFVRSKINSSGKDGAIELIKTKVDEKTFKGIIREIEKTGEEIFNFFEILNQY